VTAAKPHKASALYWIVLLLFALSAVCAIMLVRYSVSGVPLRTFFMMAALGLLVLGAPYALVEAARDLRRILQVVAAFTVLGIIVSIFAGDGPGLIVQQVIEIHVQAVISLLVVRSLVKEMGVKPVLVIFLTAWGVSGIFAFLQGLGLDFAWEAREQLGELMRAHIAYLGRERALGLSFTPIHLATQTCLALAAFYALRLYQSDGAILRRVDPKLLGMLLICGIVCISSGNRSPLLGIGIFGFCYLWTASRRLLMLAVPIVELIFQHGAFGPSDTQKVATALLFYAPAIAGYSIVKIAGPSFYALQDSRTPVIVSLITIGSNLLLNLWLNSILGFRGLALNTETAPET